MEELSKAMCYDIAEELKKAPHSYTVHDNVLYKCGERVSEDYLKTLTEPVRVTRVRFFDGTVIFLRNYYFIGYIPKELDSVLPTNCTARGIYGGMFIKIKDTASEMYLNHSRFPDYDYARKLEKICGQWVLVDTECMFKDQFNTEAITGVSKTGLRIPARYVTEVKNDARVGRGRCMYCGSNIDKPFVVRKRCPYCGHEAIEAF